VIPQQQRGPGAELVRDDRSGPAADPVPLRRNRDFMVLWSTQVVSTVGTRVTSIAFPLLVLAVTHSPAKAGVVGFAQTLPFLRAAVGVIGGVNLVFNALTLVLIVRAKQLGASPALIGVMFAFAWVGGLLGSFMAVGAAQLRRPSRDRHGRLVVGCADRRSGVAAERPQPRRRLRAPVVCRSIG
jgi:hypothetical protein